MRSYRLSVSACTSLGGGRRFRTQPSTTAVSRQLPHPGGEFESPSPSKTDASRPELVSGAIITAPPKQDLLTCSSWLQGALSPAPCGAFCYGLLTDPMALDL